MKIRSVGAEFFQADGHIKDRHSLFAVLRSRLMGREVIFLKTKRFVLWPGMTLFIRQELLPCEQRI